MKKIIFTAFVITTIILIIPQNGFSQTADSSRFGIFCAYSYEYDYFETQMGFNPSTYSSWVDNHFQNLGAHWTRSNIQLLWELIEPDLDGNYVWSIPTIPDSVITNIYDSPAQVEWLGCININILTHNPVNNPTRWKNYLQVVVDRYNGDGSNDLNSYVKVKHWQIGNEIPDLFNAGITSAQYAQIVAMADTAIHSLDPGAKICLAAPTQGNVIDTFLVNTITQLGLMNINFELIDVHSWGLASEYKMTALPVYRNLLIANGYSNVKIWSCENGTYCYQPSSLPYQSQEEQAANLIKRYVWNFSNGLEKLMWNNLVEWYLFSDNPNDIFNSMGLIGDGQLNNEPQNEFNFKRKNYYSYKLLASTIDSYYATYLLNDNFHNELNGNYGYIYQDNNTGDNFDIFWTDNDSATYNFTITSNYQLTEMVPFDSIGNFSTQSFIAGTYNITIYKNQVYLLKKISASNIQNAEYQNDSFHIYPNPSNGKFFVSINNSQSTINNISIYNVLGEKIFQSEIKNPLPAGKAGKSEIDLSIQPEGIYFYQVTNERQLIGNGKTVIQ